MGLVEHRRRIVASPPLRKGIVVVTVPSAVLLGPEIFDATEEQEREMPDPPGGPPGRDAWRAGIA